MIVETSKEQTLSKIDTIPSDRCIPAKTVEVICDLTEEELDRTAGGASSLLLNVVHGAIVGGARAGGVSPTYINTSGYSSGW